MINEPLSRILEIFISGLEVEIRIRSCTQKVPEGCSVCLHQTSFFFFLTPILIAPLPQPGVLPWLISRLYVSLFSWWFLQLWARIVVLLVVFNGGFVLPAKLFSFSTAFRRSTVEAWSNTHTDTQQLTHARGRRSRNAFRIDSVFRVLARVHVLVCIFYFLFFYWLCVEWLPVWGLLEGSRAKPFFTVLCPPPPAPPCTAPAAIQFRQI